MQVREARSTHIRGAKEEQVVNAQNLSLRIFPSLCLAVPFLTADLALDNDDADPGVLDWDGIEPGVAGKPFGVVVLRVLRSGEPIVKGVCKRIRFTTLVYISHQGSGRVEIFGVACLNNC